MGPDDEDDDKDDVIGPDDEELTQEDLAAIQDMESKTPMPRGDEAEADDEGDKGGGKASARASDKAKAEDDAAKKADEDDDEEVAVTLKQGADGKTTEYIPRSAYLREKQERKAARDRAAELEAHNARLAGRFDILANLLGVDENGQPKQGAGKKTDADAKNPWDEETIKPEDDYVKAMDQAHRRQDYLREQNAATNKRLDSLDAANTERAVVDDYMRDTKRFANEQIAKGEVVEVTSSDGKTKQTVPAFTAAYIHLLNLRHGQLEAVGYTDENERKTIIAGEEKALVHAARANKKSPAEVIYQYALKSGFSPPTRAAKGNGSQEENTDTRSAAEKAIDERNENIKRTKSLGGAGGQGFGGLTAKQIADMDDDDFGALVDKLGEEGFARKFLGAR